MAHYAFLDENNFVTEVIVGVDENQLIDGLDPETWYGNFKGQRCVRTSYNHNVRKRFAGIGHFYNETADVFIEPKPFPSWSLDENYDWQAPTPRPDILNKRYFWDEESLSWVEIEGEINDTTIAVLGE